MLQFLLAAGRLKQVKRAGWVRRGIVDCESVADHSWRIALLATLLAPSQQGFSEAQVGRAIRMALLHDVQESLAGDMIPEQHGGPTKAVKQQLERSAIDQLCAMLPESCALQADLKELWEEYEAGVTPVALFVKDLDKLEMLIQATEYERKHEGLNLQEFFDGAVPQIESEQAKGILNEITKEREK